MGFNGGLSFEIWIDIWGCGQMGMVVLNISGEDIEWRDNHKHKFFVWKRHG